MPRASASRWIETSFLSRSFTSSGVYGIFSVLLAKSCQVLFCAEQMYKKLV